MALSAQAQHRITGNFAQLAGQQVRLVGFDGFGIYTIDSTMVTSQGVFALKYADTDKGMGYLTAADNKAYFVVLDHEDIQLKGDILSTPESITVVAGNENKKFVQYATEHAKREQALNAWVYLEKMYRTDSLYSKQTIPQQAIKAEKMRLEQEDKNFLNGLDQKSYISWFLPTRKLVSSVSTVAQYRTEEIPATLAAFRKLNYTDKRFDKSGLLKDAIDSHYWLLENMGKPLDSIVIEMNISTDYLLANLSADQEKFNTITSYLFGLMERHSLFKASEYLAIKVLTQNSCTVNEDLAKQLESYRTMKIGNTAPEIHLSGDKLRNGNTANIPERLSEIGSAYTLVIFGASWCPKCADELAQIPQAYQKWKSKDVEVVFVSLDTDKTQFQNFAKIFPFISMCDYKKWETQSAKDYYVFASPTMFLLDKDQKIILRPISVAQVNTYVDYYIGK